MTIAAYSHQDDINKARWIIGCIVAFLAGLIIGIIFHDRLMRSDPGRPVWKSSPIGMMRYHTEIETEVRTLQTQNHNAWTFKNVCKTCMHPGCIGASISGNCPGEIST